MTVLSLNTKQKYGSLLAGNSFYDPYAYKSIATVTVGSGGSSSIEFTSIPSTYTHLQIRCFGHLSGTGNIADIIRMTFNSDTAANYSYHLLLGNGSAASAEAASGASWIYIGNYPDSYSLSSAFGVNVIDILDYKDTNKYKTSRSLYGYDFNDATYSRVGLGSGNWRSTNAITSIKLVTGLGLNFTQYSHFALYGIKG